MPGQYPVKTPDFNLANYFSLIGLSGYETFPKLNLDFLNAIVRQHLATFHYQNRYLYKNGMKPREQRQIPSLAIQDIWNQMLQSKFGYCFQHLELLNAVLTGLGYNVERFLAQNFMQDSRDFSLEKLHDRPKTHELLIININNKKYIVDVGIGNRCLRYCLELKEGEQTIKEDQYRLRKIDNRWILDSKTAKQEKWFCYYHFIDTSVSLNEIHHAHETLYLADKNIPIRDDMVYAGKTTMEKRKYACWDLKQNLGLFKSFRNNNDSKPVKTISFTELSEFESFCQKKFGK